MAATEKFRVLKNKRPHNVLFIITQLMKYQTISLEIFLAAGERRHLSCSHALQRISFHERSSRVRNKDVFARRLTSLRGVHIYNNLQLFYE